MSNSEIELRPVFPEDREILVKIYESSREIELSMTNWGVEQRRAFAELQLEAQTRHYAETYPDATHSIILFKGESAGRLYVNRGDTQIAILDISVLPEYRDRGIATQLIQGLISEARPAKKSIRVYVESFNPAQRLFIGLGFQAVEQEGINIRFERTVL